jgi:hypothetical protein
MPRRVQRPEAANNLSSGKGEVRPPLDPDAMNEPLPETVTLGLGSRSSFVETTHGPPTLARPRGLLCVPPEVEAEVRRQAAKHAMTVEYLKSLRDRLTLDHYFSGAPVALRRTPEGIEVLAAGLDEIAELRRTCTPEQRQGIVYGVG